MSVTRILTASRRTIAWFGDGLLVRLRAGQPGFFRSRDLAQRLIRRLAVCGAELQVGNVRNPTLVLFAPKKIDVILAHLVTQS